MIVLSSHCLRNELTCYFKIYFIYKCSDGMQPDKEHVKCVQCAKPLKFYLRTHRGLTGSLFVEGTGVVIDDSRWKHQCWSCCECSAYIWCCCPVDNPSIEPFLHRESMLPTLDYAICPVCVDGAMKRQTVPPPLPQDPRQYGCNSCRFRFVSVPPSEAADFQVCPDCEEEIMYP